MNTPQASNTQTKPVDITSQIKQVLEDLKKIKETLSKIEEESSKIKTKVDLL